VEPVAVAVAVVAVPAAVVPVVPLPPPDVELAVELVELLELLLHPAATIRLIARVMAATIVRFMFIGGIST
jgi:hypothetical protein